jgi:hypothetical protein
MSTQAIPLESRSPKLKIYLRSWAEHVVTIKGDNPELFKGVSLSFYYLCMYWLLPADQQHDPLYQERRKLIEQSGFEGERIKAELEEILSEDQHLKECCETTLNLAYCVDWNFLYTVVSFIEENKLTNEIYEKLFEMFSEITYQQPFKKFTLSHLYNFDSTETIIPFDGLHIIRPAATEIPEIIGDTSVYNFLHNHQTGDYYVVTSNRIYRRVPRYDWLAIQ